MRVWKTIYHANENQKKAGVAILLSDQLDFMPKTIIKEMRKDTISYSKGLSNKKI